MTLETFFEQFELLADAPNGVQKLRELILQLAVQGKLIPQDPNDKSVLGLLDEIQSNREQAFKDKKVKKTANQALIHLKEVPFQPPVGWVWKKFGEIAEIVSGVTKGRNLSGRRTATYPYLRVANVQRNFLDLSVMKDIEIPVEELDKYQLEVGDILLTEGGDWDKLGRSAVWQGEIDNCIHQNHVFRARLYHSNFVPEWIILYTNSLIGRRYFELAAKRTTNLASINMTQLRNCPLPIPPVEEQKRIIAKVDRLMAMCDRLEEQQKKRRESCIRLNEGAIAQLLSASNAEESDRHWQRICNNFDLFYSLPENIAKLRQAILQLAVQGKLVSQNLDEADLVEKGLPVTIQNNDLLQLPRNWNLLTVNEACSHVVDCPHSTPKFTEEGYFCIDTTCISQGKILFEKARYVTEETFNQRTKRLVPQEGDVLFSREGTIGISAVVPKDVKLCLGQRMMMYRLHEFLDSSYFLYFLASPFFQKQLISKTTGTAAKHVNIGDIRKMVVIVPPLVEQKSIIAKVDRLMKLCDELEAKLKDSYSHQENLMGVAAAQLVQAAAKTPVLC